MRNFFIFLIFMFFSANNIFASDEKIENDRKITRKIAITMDGLDLTRYEEIISIIKKFDVKLTIFVNENLANEMTELHKVQDFSEDEIVKIFKIYRGCSQLLFLDPPQ